MGSKNASSVLSSPAILMIINLFPDTDTFPRELDDLEMITPDWGEDLGRLDETMFK